VSDGNGSTLLLVIGGKEGGNVTSCNFSNSVIGFDMKAVFEPWTKTADNFSWKSKAKMASPRANFAHLVLDNFVYVFGGI